MNKHRIEYWNHFSGLAPKEIRIENDGNVIYLEEYPEYSDWGPSDIEVPEKIRQDAERTWSDFLAGKTRKEFKPTQVMREVSADGRKIRTSDSSYKTGLWLKKELSSYPFESQEELANLFPTLNIGIITQTKDGMIAFERRPEHVTAPLMLLNYPCGHVNKGETPISESVNNQSLGELGFNVLDETGNPIGEKSIRSLGLMRESDEWTAMYIFNMKLDTDSTHIKPTKETSTIEFLPADPSHLINIIVDLYSPSVKGDWVKGKLIPNASAMLMSYIRESGGENEYHNLIDKLEFTARKLGYSFSVEEYAVDSSPF